MIQSLAPGLMSVALAAAVAVACFGVLAGAAIRRLAARRLRRRLDQAGAKRGLPAASTAGDTRSPPRSLPRLTFSTLVDVLRRRLSGGDEVSDIDLADLLAVAVRRLRGGDGLEGSLAEAVATASGAAAERLEPVVTRARQGASLEAGLVALAGGPGQGTVAGAARSLALAVEVGGSQAEALDAIVAGLRRRHRLHLELDALAAQARASAMVMVAAPLVFGVLALTLDARIRSTVVSEPVAGAAVAAGVGLDLVAAWWMRRIVTARR